MRTALALLVVLSLPGRAVAWGFEAHKFIADRAIDRLPAALKPLFDARRVFIVERAIDPDLWRNAGFAAEPPNHFVNIDHDAFGPYPFAGLPRDYDAAVQKFGREFIEQQGTLPWRVQEFYGRLQRAFEGLKRPSPPGYALDDIVYFSAILAHYVSDGHVPLHAVLNYDGQLTNQNGLHSRWEAELFERNRTRLELAPVALRPVPSPRDFMFDALLASNRLAADVLAADQRAAAGRDTYDDAYFDAFRDGAWPGLQQRLNDSISAVASVITAAWEAAGRPPVPTQLPRSPRKIKKQP